MAKVTNEMAERLISAKEYEAFYQSNKERFIEVTLSEYLSQLLEEKGLKAAQIVKSSGLGDYVYKLINGKKEHPSRDVLLCLGFGMQLNEAEIDTLMRITHFHELDSRDKRDAAIIFALNKSFDLQRTNEMLYELKLKTLHK